MPDQYRVKRRGKQQNLRAGSPDYSCTGRTIMRPASCVRATRMIRGVMMIRRFDTSFSVLLLVVDVKPGSSLSPGTPETAEDCCLERLLTTSAAVPGLSVMIALYSWLSSTGMLLSTVPERELIWRSRLSAT